MTINPVLAVLACALAVTGCRREAPEPATPPAADTMKPPTPAPADPEPPTAAPVDAPKPEIPSLRIATLDGGTFDLTEQRGSWVVLNFWATWCAPCLKEMPELSAFDEAREDVRTIGLAYEEIDKPKLQAFLKRRPVSYPIAIVDTFAPPADFEIPRGLPMTYLIAPDGRVAKKFVGPVTAQQLSQEIDAHAGKET